MSIDYHEPPDELSKRTRDIHRALSILCEELEAIDWYQHRLDVSDDSSLRELMLHNRNEEMEHAAMTLEWLRRTMPEFDQQLRRYLYREGPITDEPEEEEEDAHPNDPGAHDLRIGSLRRGGVQA